MNLSAFRRKLYRLAACCDATQAASSLQQPTLLVEEIADAIANDDLEPLTFVDLFVLTICVSTQYPGLNLNLFFRSPRY